MIYLMYSLNGSSAGCHACYIGAYIVPFIRLMLSCVVLLSLLWQLLISICIHMLRETTAQLHLLYTSDSWIV